jgi:hypothetical protein
LDEDDIKDDLGDLEDDDDGDRPEFILGDPEQAAKLHNSRIVIENMTISDFETVVTFANDYGRPIFVEVSDIVNPRIQTVNIPIAIDDAVFVGCLDSNKGVINKQIQFWDVVFTGEVHFNEAFFHAAVRFNGCQFEDNTDFSSALFEKTLSFNSCNFKKEVSFDGTRFKGKVDFSDSIFKKKILLTNTLFAQAVNLENVRFDGGHDATGSNIQEVSKGTQVLKQKAPESAGRHHAEPKRKAFNPWAELDKVSKKEMSRRDLFRGIRNLFPKRDDG